MMRSLALTTGILATTVALPAQTWTEVGDAGDLPTTAQVPSLVGPITRIDGTINNPAIPQGAGNDRDMYLIQIDDPATFVALTSAPALNMQMYLFDINGYGVTFNDNNPAGVFDLNARVSGLYVPGPGLYYLAVSRFDRDPTAGGNEIWTDLPLNVERAPDGPGATDPVDAWNGNQQNVSTAAYSIFLAGVSAPPSQTWTEVGDAGELPSTAQVPDRIGPLTRIDGRIDDPGNPLGAGNDRDMYLIEIGNPATFAAMTSAPAFNMQMFLFNINGYGVTFNDNNPANVFDLNAAISGQFVPGPGLYYLAVSRFDRDATAGGSEIWMDLPLNVERAPDGPGAAGAVNGWNGSQLNANTGNYSIFLTGASFPSVTCSKLTVVGDGSPGSLVNFYMTGADPYSLAVLALSMSEGSFQINFGPIGSLLLGLQSPVSLLTMNVTDFKGNAIRGIPIPMGFPYSLDFFAQVFTGRVEMPPMADPLLVFCTSNVVPFHVGDM